MIDDVPFEKADIENPPAFVLVAEEKTEALAINIEPAFSAEEAEALAQQLYTLFADGFDWSDLSDMMRLSREYLEDFSMSSVAGKREAIVNVLHRVIELTDTPFLPDDFTDSLFESMTVPFLSMIVPDNIDEFFPPVVEGTPSDNEVQDFISGLFESFEDGFEWADLSTVAKSSIRFVNQYPDLFLEEKEEMAKTIIDAVIDETGTPYLPDTFSDAIFKSLVHPIIHGVLSSF